MNLDIPDINIPNIKQKSDSKKKLAHERRTRLKDFHKWVKTDHGIGYEAYNPVGAHVIIRLYLYKPEKKDTPHILTSFDDDGSGRDNLDSQAFPYAKILRRGPELGLDWSHLKVGDVCLIPEDLLGVEENPKWMEFEMIIREKPSLVDTVARPPKMIPKIAGWQRYVFTRDKFSLPDFDIDAYTFLIPVTLLKAQTDPSLIK